MSEITRDLYADFMRNLQGCDTVTVSLSGVGETKYTTKEIYEAIDFRVNRRPTVPNEPLTLETMPNIYTIFDKMKIPKMYKGDSTRDRMFSACQEFYGLLLDKIADNRRKPESEE